MSNVKNDVIGGFNAFIDSQKEIKGTASISLVLFDNEYDMVYENVDLNSVKYLDDSTFVPRGMTALLDSVGRTINSVGERLNNTSEEERPEKVMVCIFTDGMENSSKKFTKEQIKKMIEHQR